MTASYKDQEFYGDGGIIHIKKGQLFTGRKALSEATGIPQSTIEDILKVLEKEHQIRQQTSTKYRIITILNWDKWQNPTELPTASRQQADTYKKDKKEKKDTAHSAEVSAVINLFKEVNPSYQRLFGMPPQRAAAERLLKTHGMSKMQSMVAFLVKSNASKYAPTITTPSQFEARLGELIAWSQKQKNSTKKTIVI